MWWNISQFYCFFTNMKSYEKILKSIWCSDMQVILFETLRKYWAKPASTLAKLMGAERTHVYKMLQQMVWWWIIAQSDQQSVSSFFIPSPTVLDSYYAAQQALIEQSRLALPEAYAELEAMGTMATGQKPLYRMREWHEGMKQMIDIMIQQLEQDHLMMIRFFSLSTLETAATTPYTLKDYAYPLFQYCKSHIISVQTILGSGIMIPEQIIQSSTIEELENLPAWQSSMYVFVVWTSVYFLVFKQVPLAFKRDLPELADLFHFFAKVMGK